MQALKIQWWNYNFLKANNCGFVRFKDFLIEEDIIVVKNEGIRWYIKWI